MDNFLYNYFGYNKDYVLNKNASLIQKTYKNYKDYKIKKTQDYIKYFSLFNSKSCELLEKENHIPFYASLRNSNRVGKKIKYTSNKSWLRRNWKF